MLPDRASNAESWDFDKLVTILLRQFKRLLADKGIELTEAEMRQLGEQAANHDLSDTRIAVINAALSQLIEESLNVLAQWELSYAQSLTTTMADLTNWETTADFLAIANEKVNAEVRISAGASLMVALGDARHARFLIEAIDHDLNAESRLDVDAMIGKRALLFAAGVDHDADDWRGQMARWVDENLSI